MFEYGGLWVMLRFYGAASSRFDWSMHLTHGKPVTRIPSLLLWETFSHAAINAQSFYKTFHKLVNFS